MFSLTRAVPHVSKCNVADCNRGVAVTPSAYSSDGVISAGGCRLGESVGSSSVGLCNVQRVSCRISIRIIMRQINQKKQEEEKSMMAKMVFGTDKLPDHADAAFKHRPKPYW